MKCLVTGGSGFIGSYLVKYLAGMDYDVKAVDIKYPEFESSAAREFVLGDLRNPTICAEVVRNVDVIYHLAATMGGIGFITKELASIAYDNTLIDLNMLKAASDARVWRFFFSSSACFVAGTPVLTLNGVKRIEDICVGDFVLSHRGQWCCVSATFSRPNSGRLVMLHRRGLPDIVCTEDHPILDDTGAWISACDATSSMSTIVPEGKGSFQIEEPDRLVCAWKEIQTTAVKHSRGAYSLSAIGKRFAVGSASITKMGRGEFPRRCDPVSVAAITKDFDLGVFMGLYLAEGWIEKAPCRSGQRRIVLSFNDDEQYLADRCASVLYTHFGVPKDRVVQYKMPDQKGFKIHVTSNRLALLMEQCFYSGLNKRARNKTLCADILDSPHEFLRGLLVGWWFGDGSMQKRFGEISRYIWSTSSWQLAHTARTLFHTFGIETSIQVVNSSRSVINGRAIIGSGLYSLYTVGNGKSIFSRMLQGPVGSSTPLSRDVVASIPFYKECMVYNLEVEGDSSYSVGGMAVHNCVYNTLKQNEPNVLPLKEEDAWPAMPERGYGLAKLYTEELCSYFAKDYGLDVRVARFHNVFGKGTYKGGREKAPAALCRKVAEAPDGGTITVWGDGAQTRSFLYIDDCVEGIYRLLHSGHSEPLNLGSDRLISIADLARMIIGISGKTLDLAFDLTKPQGVRGRNSDNEMMRQVLGWEPTTTLEDGLSETYFWIEQQVRRGSWTHSLRH